MEQFSDRVQELWKKIDGYRLITELWVPGNPATAGSKHAIPNQRKDGSLYTIMVPANNRQKDWQASVAYTARQTYYDPPTAAPIRLHCLFTFVRPKSHTTKRGALSKGAAFHPTGHNVGDLTKLVRCVEDALTGIVWLDDSQVVEQCNAKYYGLQAGVMVRVFEVTTGTS